jgi:hypothetical protein
MSQQGRALTVLALPSSGPPLCAIQVEEFTGLAPETMGETRRSVIHRDSAGRMRIDTEFTMDGRYPLLIIRLVDPVAHFTAILESAGKVAYKSFLPAGTGFGFPMAVNERIPQGSWQRSTESLGARSIEGFEFQGTRSIKTSGEHPGFTVTEERWTSRELMATGLLVSAGPTWRNTARLENIVREEPDSALFAIPDDYEIS